MRGVIDLRSDTVTQPTPGMRQAIADAEVGDEQKREDPTVTALQERVATLLGQEAALFLPTATMANQIALKLHGRPGDVLVAEETSHVLVYEYGGVAAHAGLVTLGIPGNAGRISSEQLRAATAPSTKAADQRVTVLSLENTHNNAGGRVWPLTELEDVVGTARELGLAVHLDGARLLNASTALRVEPAEIASRFDTVTLCLSKGLGCPLGALLVGSEELIDRAWREKHLFGGAMRQAGVVAAAGVYALDHHVERLKRRPRPCQASCRGTCGGRACPLSSTAWRRTSSRSMSGHWRSIVPMRSPDFEKPASACRRRSTQR